MFTPEQLTATQQNQVAALFSLSQKAFAGVEKFVELNLQAARTALDEVAATTLSAKDPQQLFTLQGEALQPAAETAAAYGRRLYAIVAETNAEVSQFAEDGVAQARAQWLALVDNAVKNAPAGSEKAASLLKTGVVAANDAFDSLQRVAKQTAEDVQANVVALTARTIKSVPAKGKRAA